LCEILKRRPASGFVRDVAFRTLVQVKAKETTQVLMGLVSDEDVDLQQRASTALKEIQND
jgi:hypothetical protein